MQIKRQIIGDLMRLIILVSLLIILIITTAFISFLKISSTSTDLLNNLETLEEYVHLEQWEKAIKTGHKINQQWDQANSFFSLMIDHEQLHDLNIIITRISSLIEHRQKEKTITEIRIARKLIENIPEEEKPLLKNIF